MIEAAIWNVLLSFASYATISWVCVAILFAMAVRTGSTSMAVGGIVVLVSSAVTTFYVHQEREACEARFMAAEQNFEDLQTEVGQLVDQVAARSKVVLTEKERVNAEELRSIRVRLAESRSQACIATGADAADDRRLRNNGTGKDGPQG